MPPPFPPLYNDQGRQLNHGAILSSQIWTTPVTPSQYHCTGTAHISHRSITAHTGVLKWIPLPNSSRTSCLCPPKLAQVCALSLSLSSSSASAPGNSFACPSLLKTLWRFYPPAALAASACSLALAALAALAAFAASSIPPLSRRLALTDPLWRLPCSAAIPPRPDFRPHPPRLPASALVAKPKMQSSTADRSKPGQAITRLHGARALISPAFEISHIRRFHAKPFILLVIKQQFESTLAFPVKPFGLWGN